MKINYIYIDGYKNLNNLELSLPLTMDSDEAR